MRTLVAWVVSLLLVPVVAAGVTFGIAKAAGGLVRWSDGGFSWPLRNWPIEFAIALLRGFSAVAVARLVFALMGIEISWIAALVVLAPLAAWDITVLRFHQRYSLRAILYGIRSHSLDDALLDKDVQWAHAQHRWLEGALWSSLCGDVAGVGLGAMILGFLPTAAA